MGAKPCCEEECGPGPAAPGSGQQFKKPAVPAVIFDQQPAQGSITSGGPGGPRDAGNQADGLATVVLIDNTAAPAPEHVLELTPMPAPEPPKEPQAAPPAAPLDKFEVTLAKDDQGEIGLMFLQQEGMDGVLLVSNVRDGGSASKWNAANADKVLRRGDHVVALNGQPADRQLLTDLAAKGDVTMSIARWEDTFSVSFSRSSPETKLGMKVELVERNDGARILRIGEIRGGLLQAHNKKRAAEGRMDNVATSGTELLKVCGIANSPEEMMAALQTDSVELLLKRPDPSLVERLLKEQEAARASGAGGAARAAG